MVAAVPRPPFRNTALELLDRSPRDGGIWAKAMLVALAVHLLAFWIPLPERKAPPPRQPVAELPTITRPILRPPPLEPPVSPSATRPGTPRALLPAPDAVDITPVVEPRQFRPDAASAEHWDVDPIALVPEAPPLPAVVDEHFAGLIVPVALSRPRPDYPPLARTARRGGSVLLRAVIGVNGEVEQIEVLQAPNPDLGFSAAAVEAVGRWRYAPGRVGDRPVAVAMTVSIEFTLR